MMRRRKNRCARCGQARCEGGNEVCDACLTDEDLDRLIAKQMACLPPWWGNDRDVRKADGSGQQRIVRIVKVPRQGKRFGKPLREF